MLYTQADTLLEGLHHVEPEIELHRLTYHHKMVTFSDAVARNIVHLSARAADLMFKKRYGERAIVLETIAAVPGMVGGLLQHLQALRFIREDHGWIKTLVDEAENERIHLMVYSAIVKPTKFERLLIMVVQFFFYNIYFFLYLISAKTAHRVVGYFEEEAIASYTHYLGLIDAGEIANVPAPEIAKKYWGLAEDARLREVVIATRNDEVIHRDVNHEFADSIKHKIARSK